MYKLIFEKCVFKDLDKVPAKDLNKIQDVFESLKRHPRQSASKKLKDRSGRYRIRKGDYRIVYIIEDKIKTVKIALVGHRRDVYHKR